MPFENVVSNVLKNHLIFIFLKSDPGKKIRTDFMPDKSPRTAALLYVLAYPSMVWFHPCG